MTPWPRHEQASGIVHASAVALFDHLDDPLRLSSHMQRGSMAMMGGSMTTTTDALGGRAIGSSIRMHGRVLGLRLELEETVVERAPPVFKAWETRGEPRLLVIGAYRMGFLVVEDNGGCRLTVFIDYALPAGPLGRALGFALAPLYSRWCCTRMLQDAQEAFDAHGTPAHTQGG